MASSMPLRPSLQRAPHTTNSVPQLVGGNNNYNNHERPLARSIPGFNPTTSLPTPHQQSQMRKSSFGQQEVQQPRKPSFGHDMLRTESADSHRSLKQKHSRKDLKELARSGSPLVTTFQAAAAASSSKHKYSRSWDDDDDDARSISSFTCSFANEFDARHKARLEYGNEETITRQRFLDAVFRKLTQKTGIHKRESRAWAAVEKTIQEEQSSNDQAVQSKATKFKLHFLDLSNYISPVPSPTTHTADSNITPRQADIERFKGLSSDQQSNISTRQRPVLRARRSADALGETRRLQREEWNAPQGAATTDSIPSGAVNINAPAGMSQAMTARGGHSHSPSPVPILPDWARSNNLSLHQRGGQNRSIDSTKSQDAVSPTTHRAIDMGRAASHDASTYLSRNTSRPAIMARGVSGPVRGSPSEQVHLQLRGQGRLPRSLASPMTPISPQWPRSAHTPREDCISPISVTPSSQLHRSSVSSAASDSASSGMSSVPQTPISRKIPLSGYSHQDDEIEMTIDDEENLLSAMGQYALENGKGNNILGVDRFGRIPHSMTQRPTQKKSPHVASLFDSTNSTASRSSHYKSSSSDSVASASSIQLEEKEGNSTVKANRIQSRPRASTTSSTQSPTRPRTSPEVLTILPSGSPESPNRSSSLQKKGSSRSTSSQSHSIQHQQKHRESVMSSHSTASTTSSQSHSESLLSYTRASPSRKCQFPTTSDDTSPRSTTTTTTTSQQVLASSASSVSQRKRTTSKAEDWASSIGRRFTKGVAASSINDPVPHLPTNYTSLSPLEA